MAKSLINLGTTPNDRTGDTLRDAGSKVNSNINELYNALGNGTQLQVSVSGATAGQVLKYNGSTFVPATDLNTDAVTSVNTKTGVVVLGTDDVAEGSTNKYYTDARARAAISVTDHGMSYDPTTGVISYTQGNSDTVAEGTNNLYYTQGRFNFSLSQKTTDDLTEGTTHKYFSQSLARGSISVSGDLSYNNSTGVISYSTPALADVATTGSYNDLSDTPIIPSILPTNKLAASTAPASAKGASGDTAGSITHDQNYIYLCVANWIAAASHATTSTRDGTAVTVVYVANTEVEPQVGGTISVVGGDDQTILSVATDGSDWEITVGTPVDYTTGDAIVYTDAQPDIWKRTAISTW